MHRFYRQSKDYIITFRSRSPRLSGLDAVTVVGVLHASVDRCPTRHPPAIDTKERYYADREVVSGASKVGVGTQ